MFVLLKNGLKRAERISDRTEEVVVSVAEAARSWSQAGNATQGLVDDVRVMTGRVELRIENLLDGSWQLVDTFCGEAKLVSDQIQKGIRENRFTPQMRVLINNQIGLGQVASVNEVSVSRVALT